MVVAPKYLKTNNLNITAILSWLTPKEAIAEQDMVCPRFGLYDNAISCIHTYTPIRISRREVSKAESYYLWVSFEPVNDDGATYIYLCFSLDFLKEVGLISDDTKEPSDQIRVLAEFINGNRFIISHLRLEYYSYLSETENTRFRKIYRSKWLSKVTYSLINYLNEMTTSSEGEGNISKADKIKILQLEAELSKRLDFATPELKDMANSLNMSTSKFQTIFKEIYNETPHQYFLKKKLDKAVELLQTRNYTFSEISYRLGFSHPSGLTRLFKSKLGETPTSLFELKE